MHLYFCEISGLVAILLRDRIKVLKNLLIEMF